ncbi:response regulator transcription factor [Eggerthella sinensis]|nr:LuxR family transcriptional regulator [Eggerthella sinensis]
MQESRAFLRYLNAQPKLVLRPSLLLLAPFLASMPLYVPNVRIMRDLIGSTSGVDPLVTAMAGASLLLSAALAFFSSRRPSWPGFGHRMLVGGAAGYVVLETVLWSTLSLGSLPPVWFACIGMVLAACSMPIAMAWVARYALDVRNVMFHGALACVGAALLGWALSLLPALPAALLGVACAGVGAGGALLRSGRDTKSVEDSMVACRNVADATGAVGAGIGAAVGNLMSVIWLPLVGFLICTFTSASCEFSIDGVTLRSEFIGGMAASIVAVALCLMHRKTPFVLLVDKLVVPGLIAVSVVLGSFPANSMPFVLGAAYIFVPMMFLSLFALASLVAIAAAGEFSLPFVFGAAFFSSNLVTLVGLASGGGLASSDTIGPVLWVVICCYFACVIVQLGYSSWRDLCRPYDDDAVEPARSAIDPDAIEEFRRLRIEVLADGHGLTNRERELLDYLSRGYGSSFIAKNLFISDNTARTHIRNIYRKLGVGSREELLSLFNEAYASET